MFASGLIVISGLMAAQSSGLVVKGASVSLVPPEALPLGGYTARGETVFEPGGDDLRARVLVFEEGGKKVVLVSLEVLTVPESLVAGVKEGLPEGVDLMMVATHTHGAPDSQMLNRQMTFRIPGIAPYNRKWAAWYTERILEGVNLAIGGKGESVDHTVVKGVDADFNRGRREGAVPSKTLGALRIGAWKLVNYSAHATLMDETRLKLSGDWPGAVMRSGQYLVLPGAIGDVSPKVGSVEEGASGEEKVEAMGKGLLGFIDGEGARRGVKLGFGVEKIEFGGPQPHPEFATSFGANDALAKIVVDKFAPKESVLTVMTIGETALVGVPGEPTTAVGEALRRTFIEAGWKTVWVVSHVNGWAGYLLTPEDYDKGGYEATLQFFGRDAAGKVIEAGERLAGKLKLPGGVAPLSVVSRVRR